MASISRFPDREWKFPEPGNKPSGPEKSGIGKPELAIPSSYKTRSEIFAQRDLGLRTRGFKKVKSFGPFKKVWHEMYGGP